jgi:hypothetical protein
MVAAAAAADVAAAAAGAPLLSTSTVTVCARPADARDMVTGSIVDRRMMMVNRKSRDEGKRRVYAVSECRVPESYILSGQE